MDAMLSAQALDLLCDVASRWGENTEEGFPKRLTGETTDEEIATLAEGDADEIEEMTTVRDLWRAVAYVQDIIKQRGCEHFDPAVSNGKLTSLIDIIVLG